MTNITEINEIEVSLSFLIKEVESNFFQIAEILYGVRSSASWQSKFATWEDFLDEVRLSKSTASMLLKVYKHFVIDGGRKTEQLIGAGYSNLYEAIPLLKEEDVDTVIAKAKTLTRSELKAEVKEEKYGAHDCEIGKERWAICKECGKFIRIHDAV